jgi:proline dehydrogenase
LLEKLVRDAGARGSFVRIDMEDASCVDDTLALYRSLRDAGLDNVGIVLQAYLKRTLTDIAELRDLRPSVRLCKGIYVEPGAIAFSDADVIRRSFVACVDTLLDGGSRVAIATHDEQLIGESLVRTAALPPDGYEFQMLLGVRESRADELVAAGHPLRVYVPFGQRWYEYSLRRLQENPQMAGVIAKATVARAVGRG